MSRVDMVNDGAPPVPAQTYLASERVATTKHERWQGRVYPMEGASFVHNLVTGNVIRLLGELVVDGPFVVLASAMKVHIPSVDGYAYPDVSVVGDVAGGSGDVISAPLIVVEVASDLTECFDRGEKFGGYRSLPSLVEYLLVAETRAQVEHYVRGEGEAWVLREFGPGARLQLEGVDGVLAVDDVYRKVVLN